MARERYPSDENRLKMRPHVRVHLTVATHRRTAAIWADLESRAMLVELWRLAAEAFAGKTDDTVCLSPAAVRSVTGRERHFAGVSRLATLCSRVGYEIRTDGSATFVTVRNFARKQGFDSARRGATTRTPHPSELRSPNSEDRVPKTEEERERNALARSLNLLAREPGSEAEKRAFLEAELSRIEAEAFAALPADRAGDKRALNAKIRSMILGWYRQRRRNPDGPIRSGPSNGRRLTAVEAGRKIVADFERRSSRESEDVRETIHVVPVRGESGF